MTLRAAAAIVAIMLIAGCSDGGGGPVTTATPVQIDGVGPLKVGMTVADAEKAAGAKISVHNNEDPQGECVIADVTGWPKDVSFMLIKGTIARFNVYEGVMKTAEGAGIGSTEDEVKKLYANAKVDVLPHKYVDGHYLEITMPGVVGLQYVFETDGSKVTAFRSGRLPEVGFVEGCA